MSEDRKKKIETIAKWGIGLGGAIIISPFIFLAVKGIVGLGIAIVVGLAVVNFSPFVAMKFANWKVKAVVYEAKTNPVETLINTAVEREDQLRKYKESITKFRTEVSGFESKVLKFRKQFPDEAAKFDEQLDNMKKLLLYRVEKYQHARIEHDHFLKTVDKARALWEMSQEAQRMNKIAGTNDEQFMEKLKTDVSLDSVTKSVNQAFSELETSLMEDEINRIPKDYKPSIEYKPAKNNGFEDIIEPEIISIERKVRV